MLKRLLSAVLAGSVFLSGLSAVGASAASEDVHDSYGNGLALAEAELIGFPDGIEYGPDDNVFHMSVNMLIRPLSLFTSGAHNFYDGLTYIEKTAYDIMKLALDSDPTVAIVDIDGITDIETLARAYCALIADHPEYFWLFGAGFGYVDNGDGTLSDLDVRFGYCAGQDANNIVSNYSKLMTVVNRVAGEAEQYGTDYEKIKYFATYISDNMSYNSNAASKGGPEMSAYANCWNAYGALVSGSGVCEAYAEAFKLLCDTAGIPCVSMYSFDHEWNAVKLDGKWYYVDVTWIDTGNKSTYQYKQWLAVGTASAKKNDNAGGSHTPETNTILSSVNSNFTYPTISSTDYEPASGSGEGTGTGTGSGTGSGSGAGSYSGKVSPAAVSTKDIKTAGTTSYSVSALLAVPSINVTMPSVISAVINPYGTPISTRNGDYGADGVTSPVYTIRNKTQSNAVAVRAETYLTVPKDKTGEPTITVCANPDDVKKVKGKALSAYLLAFVSESSVKDEGSESKDLLEANNVEYARDTAIVFADATVNAENSNKGTLMVIPRAKYEDNTLAAYYYGHFRISGAVTDSSAANWNSSDKVTLVVVFNIAPCPDP